MILSLFLGILFSLILFLPTFFTIRNRGLNYRYLKKMKCKIFSCKKKKKLLLLDENSLQSQPLFWAVIALPLAIGIMLWAAIADNYDLKFTSDAYSNLMKNAQFPFVILALSPILGAFVVYAHRSYQTDIQIKTAKEQLEEAQNKNKIDLYLSTKKNRLDLLSKISNIHDEKIARPVSLYMKGFIAKNEHIEYKNDKFYYEINEFFILITKELDNLANLQIDSLLSESIFIDIEKIKKTQNWFLFFENINSIINKLNEFLYLEKKEDNKIINIYNKHVNLINGLMQNNQIHTEPFDNKFIYNHMKMISNLMIEIKSSVDTACEIAFILSDNQYENDLFPNFKDLYNIENKINKKITQVTHSYIGDKVATENQNNHE